MGIGLSSIFGGGYSAPDPVVYEPAPSTAQSEAEEKGVREAERKRARARAGGVRATLLQNPLGSSQTLGSPGSGS